jgi:hypothetical protein
MNPLSFLRDILAEISTASPWALLLTKATLLLAIVWVVHFRLARANPRWRTLLWRGTVLGLVLMAVWTLGLPGLEIRIQTPAPAATILATSLQPMVAEREPAIAAVDSVQPIREPASVEPAAAARHTSGEIRPEAARPIESWRPSLAWWMILLGIWGFGVALLVLRLTIAYVRLANLLQTSEAASEEMIAEVGRIAAALGCHRAVQVRSLRQEKGTGPICRNGPTNLRSVPGAAHKLDLSPFPAVPFLYGLRRPLLVLPERMCQPAYRGQLPAVIAHELTHVGSCDFAWNVALQAVATILWFHPLVWRIGSAHRAACDAVCDAVSASYLGDVQAYCRTLARVALEGAGSIPTAGLAMARTCDVRRRIAVLQQRVFAAALDRRAVVGVALVGLLSLALLAGVRLALAASAQATPGTEQAAPSRNEPAGAGAKDTAGRTIRGKVVDEAGKPVADADVWLSAYCGPPGAKARVQHVKSDSQGQFTVEVPPAWVTQNVPDSSTTIWACGAGRQLGTKHGQQFTFEGDPSDLVIRLKPATDTSFVVLDPAGQPLTGALVQPYYIIYEPTPEEVLRHIEARTDSEGRAKFPAVGRETLHEVRVITQNLGIQIQRYSDPEYPLPAKQTIHLRPVGTIKGRVLADKPEWARGMRMLFATEKMINAPPWLTEGFADVESDEQGRFVVPVIADGRLDFRGLIVDDKLPVRPQIPQFIDVEADATTELPLSMALLVPVRGSIRAKDSGAPISGAKIRMHYGAGPQYANSVSDAHGKFTARVLPGRVQLHASYNQEKYVQRGSVSCNVPEQTEGFELPTLEVTPTKSFAGRLIDESGRPVANAGVYILVKEDNRIYGSGTSDSNGQFHLDGVPATIDTAKAKYEANLETDPTRRNLAAEVTGTNPLILRVKTGSRAEDGTMVLAEAVRAINQQAAKLWESRTQKPLTEDEVVKAIELLGRNERLSDAEYQELKRIVETRRLPKDVVLRHFVRYNDGTGVQHGWWVRLLLVRDSKSPFVSNGTFSLTIRQESPFRRPYTQKERQFQEEFHRTGSLPLMNRLVAYFDEDPKFGVVQNFSPQEADRLANTVKKATNDKKVDDLLMTYHWDGVDKETRGAVRAEAEKFVKRPLASVSVSPRRFGGRLHHWQGLKTWDPNLPVRGYVVLEFSDAAEPKAVWLEFGETAGDARLVNYIVSRDDGPRMVGKPVSGTISMSGSIPLVHLGGGWYDFYLQIEAPDDWPALQNANFEVWKIRP